MEDVVDFALALGYSRVFRFEAVILAGHCEGSWTCPLTFTALSRLFFLLKSSLVCHRQLMGNVCSYTHVPYSWICRIHTDSTRCFLKCLSIVNSIFRHQTFILAAAKNTCCITIRSTKYFDQPFLSCDLS